MKKRIRKTICDRSGSYITEAAVFLPVLIISLCALTLLVRIIGICEEVCFITAEEILETDLQAYKNKITVSFNAAEPGGKTYKFRFTVYYTGRVDLSTSATALDPMRYSGSIGQSSAVDTEGR